MKLQKVNPYKIGLLDIPINTGQFEGIMMLHSKIDEIILTLNEVTKELCLMQEDE